MSGVLSLPPLGNPSWKSPVDTATSLPSSGNTIGDARATEDTGTVYIWTGSAWTAPSGAGTVTSVGLSTASAAFLTAGGTPVTGVGTLTLTLATQVKNLVFSGPGTGADAAPTFRALVGADLPLPAAATLGGVFSKAAVSHNFLTSISSADGSIGQAQPAFTDISGSVAASQLPVPGAASLGGVFSKAAVSNNFLTSISSVDGSIGQAQPAFTNISGTATVAQGGTGLTSGTSGGVLAYTATGTLASSGALTASAIVLGGGAGVAPTVLGSLGTTTTLLHGNAAGAPTFGAVSLTADVTGTLPVANGGTNSATSLNSNRFMVSSSGAVVEASAVTASRAVVSDSNGLPTAATTTSTEIGYVNGVTSAIQTQLNLLAPKASPQFSGTIGLGTSAQNDTFFEIIGTGLTQNQQFGIYTSLTASVNATNGGYGYTIALTSANSSFTCSRLVGFYMSNPTKGAASTLTRNIGLLVDGLTSATNNAVFSDNLTFTGNWFLNYTGANPSIFGSGSVIVGNAAIATNATDGFLYIPTCAGTPTGTPTTRTGTVALVYDTTNNKLYIYNGAWKGGTAPGVWS